eukprot:91034-Prorocentrum_lima.AAC.1
MTSSLVGSEMCIRDSASARAARGADRAQPSLPLRPGPGRVPEGTLPVSYTHLTLPTICSV